MSDNDDDDKVLPGVQETFCAAQDLLFSNLVAGKRATPHGVINLDGEVVNHLPQVAQELAREYGVRKPGE